MTGNTHDQAGVWPEETPPKIKEAHNDQHE